MAVPAIARIILVDPPFAYGRQMVLEDGSRVPYDEDAIAAQRERDSFRSSIQRDSEELVARMGLVRIHLADRRDAAHLAGDSHLEAALRAMLREAA